MRGRLVRAAAAAIALSFALAAGAQTYPQKPVRITVPYPPGGTVDLVARHLAQQLGTQVGQQVIVENRAGANGTIGSDFVSKAAPDGYTLLVQASIFVINPLFLKNVPYDVQRDFAPVVEHRLGAAARHRPPERAGGKPARVRDAGPGESRQVHLRDHRARLRRVTSPRR